MFVFVCVFVSVFVFVFVSVNVFFVFAFVPKFVCVFVCSAFLGIAASKPSADGLGPYAEEEDTWTPSVTPEAGRQRQLRSGKLPRGASKLPRATGKLP